MQYTNLPVFQIGKEGLNKEHLIKALKDHKMIKIRFLKKEFGTLELPGEIVKKIGRTIVLREKKRAKY
jgi:RNA-binding protein YhbY